jgi:uncharacterized membrane protein
MKTKDIFKLAVRLLGLVFLYHGLSALPAVIPLVRASGIGQFILGLVMVAWPLLVAYWLLRGAPLLMNIAYPDASGHSEGEQQVFGASEKKADA